MMCGQAKELIAASWAGELDDAQAGRLQHHLVGCSECTAEMAQLTALWERMADMPASEPGPRLHARWQATLDSFLTQRKTGPWRVSMGRVGVPALCLAAGLLIGALIPRGGPDRGEIRKLREEIVSTKEMVTLSLLRQQSATERLQGVDYTARMPMLEPQVVRALLDAVRNDESVNVRLAAIDALTKVSGDARVRQSLTQSLSGQASPMVQAALIDYAVDAHDGQAAGSLRELAGKPDLDPAIRERAQSALKRLTEYR